VCFTIVFFLQVLIILLGFANVNPGVIIGIIAYQFHNTIFSRKNREWQTKLSRASMLTLQELISNGQFESDACTLLRKPHFLLRDSIKEDEEILYDNNYKWLRQIGNWRFFLPNMEQMFPLLYLQSMYIRRLMDWDLTKLCRRLSGENR